MSEETVARRYSIALADVVLATGGAETATLELAQWNSMFQANTDLQNAFGNPAIPHASKEKLLEELINKAKPSKTTANFLRVLLRNGRLTEVGSISERFSTVLEERSGVVAAEIVSARDLEAGEKAAFQLNLEKLTGKRVRIDYSINKDIIGGVVTRIGSTVYDGSVKTKLENLKQELIGS